MGRYHTVAFDLDGTLTDPRRGLTSAFRYAFRKAGIDYGDERVLESFIGPPIRELWQSMYGISAERAEEVLAYFREYFSVYGWWDNELFEGVHEMLGKIKAAGIRIVLATGKPDVYSSKILKRFDIEQYFDFSEGASYDTSREKKADVLDYALTQVGLTSGEKRRGAVMVGDTRFDIEGAKACGADSIALTMGFGSIDELEASGADYIAHTLDDVLNIILS